MQQFALSLTSGVLHNLSKRNAIFGYFVISHSFDLTGDYEPDKSDCLL
jgi:hypothetical protein